MDYTPFEDPYEETTLSDIILPEDGTTTTTTTTTTTATTTTNGNSQQRLPDDLNDKLIPIYCSILAAVVVGVVAFIIFKRWGHKPETQAWQGFF